MSQLTRWNISFLFCDCKANNCIITIWEHYSYFTIIEQYAKEVFINHILMFLLYTTLNDLQINCLHHNVSN